MHGEGHIWKLRCADVAVVSTQNPHATYRFGIRQYFLNLVMAKITCDLYMHVSYFLHGVRLRRFCRHIAAVSHWLHIYSVRQSRTVDFQLSFRLLQVAKRIYRFWVDLIF